MLPDFITDHTTLPLIAAPMFLVSGTDLVTAACKAGVIGAFPAPNARTIEELDAWLNTISTDLARSDFPSEQGEPDKAPLLGGGEGGGSLFLKVETDRKVIAPYAVNIICHRTYPRRPAELELLQKYKVPIVITALGSPREVVEEVHAYGGIVLADVNSVKFARKAAEVGVDGLVLVAAGAGGHTGQMTGFAFVDAVRQFWDGIIVLAGGISTGRGIRAAQALGADLVYMGTRFIATNESLAVQEYRQMIVDSTADDLILTDAVTGVPANFLVPSFTLRGLDPRSLRRPELGVDFKTPYDDTKAWKHLWSAGQGVGAITEIQPVAEVVATLQQEYASAIQRERVGDAWTRRY
jgi:nitronate monooxygenase